MRKIIEVVLNEPTKLIKVTVPQGAKSVNFSTRRMPAPKPRGEPVLPKSNVKSGNANSAPDGSRELQSSRVVEVPVLYMEVHALGTPKDEVRQFVVASTDQDASEGLPLGHSLGYVGTTQLYEGSVVLHLFEVLGPHPRLNR